MIYNTRSQARLRSIVKSALTVGFPADSKTSASAAATEANQDTGKAADIRNTDIGVDSHHNTGVATTMANHSIGRTDVKKRKRTDEHIDSNSTNDDDENDVTKDTSQPTPTNERRMKPPLNKRHCPATSTHRYALRSKGAIGKTNAVRAISERSSMSGPALPGHCDGSAKS